MEAARGEERHRAGFLNSGMAWRRRADLAAVQLRMELDWRRRRGGTASSEGESFLSHLLSVLRLDGEQDRRGRFFLSFPLICYSSVQFSCGSAASRSVALYLRHQAGHCESISSVFPHKNLCTEDMNLQTDQKSNTDRIVEIFMATVIIGKSFACV
jgi:hypothetical protein